MSTTAGPSLKLLSSMACREWLAELAAACGRDLSQHVIAEAAGGVDVAMRVQEGEAVDIVVLASDAIDKLIAGGSVRSGSRVDLAKSGIGIAVPKGASAPDVSSEEAVRAAVLAAPTLGYSTGPSGTYLKELFERWGILETIKDRIVKPAPGIPVGSLVAKGECSLGFQQISELMNLSGIDVLGPLPPSIQYVTIFSGGVAAASSHPDAALSVLKFMASPAADALKRRYAMDPA